VEVCPVDCFHEGPNFLVIDPEECIDCTLCIPECPAEAIFQDDAVPEDQQDFLRINAELSQRWPVITELKDPPPDAKEWDGVSGKRPYLDYGDGGQTPWLLSVGALALSPDATSESEHLGGYWERRRAFGRIPHLDIPELVIHASIRLCAVHLPRN